MIETPQFAVLKAPGLNRDLATKAAIELAGGRADIVLIKQLVAEPQILLKYQGLMIPGGFSFGDDIQSGVVLALRMLKIKDELQEFALHNKHSIVGVCNGFQALVQSGLLPFGKMTTRDKLQATLTNNTSGRFESRWIHLMPQPSVSLYVHGDQPVTFPVDHGEGRFMASTDVISLIESNGQVVYRYCDNKGVATGEYPANPNNSVNAIAGICDPSGVILGMMPHPEDFVRREHHPNFRRGAVAGKPDGLKFFEEVVLYARES